MTAAHGYDLHTENRRGYIYAHLHAVEMTPGIAESVLREIREAVAAERAGRLMFEYELAHSMTDGQTYEFLTDVIHKMPGMHIAFVTAHRRHHESLIFAETISATSGQEYESFTDTAVAEKWLLGR